MLTFVAAFDSVHFSTITTKGKGLELEMNHIQFQSK